MQFELGFISIKVNVTLESDKLLHCSLQVPGKRGPVGLKGETGSDGIKGEKGDKGVPDSSQIEALQGRIAK